MSHDPQPWTMDLTRKATECESITGELSPHHRPIDWDELGRMTKSPASQKMVGAQAKLKLRDLQRPLRIRGQLFFDASHVPCANAAPVGTNPARRSNWEIHPIYSIEVCSFKTRAQCPVTGAAGTVWKDLSDWLAAHPG